MRAVQRRNICCARRNKGKLEFSFQDPEASSGSGIDRDSSDSTCLTHKLSNHIITTEVRYRRPFSVWMENTSIPGRVRSSLSSRFNTDVSAFARHTPMCHRNRILITSLLLWRSQINSYRCHHVHLQQFKCELLHFPHVAALYGGQCWVPFLLLQPSIELLELMGVVRENGNEQMSFPPVVRSWCAFKSQF